MEYVCVCVGFVCVFCLECFNVHGVHIQHNVTVCMYTQTRTGHVLAVLLWERCRPGPLVNVVQSTVTNEESN